VAPSGRTGSWGRRIWGHITSWGHTRILEARGAGYVIDVTEGDKGGEPGRRRYDSPVRRQQAALTRRRIVDAGTALVRELPSWDWQGLTFAAVAARASVGTRTVYRHFPTERDLHGAIIARLQQEAGGAVYEGLALGDVARVTARMHGSIASYAITQWGADVPLQPALAEVDAHRREALSRAVEEVADDWPAADQEMAAAVLDVLWNLPAYERLRGAWKLEGATATTAITWAIGIIEEAIRSGRLPSDGEAGRLAASIRLTAWVPRRPRLRPGAAARRPAGRRSARPSPGS